jgi:hypothetical protein
MSRPGESAPEGPEGRPRPDAGERPPDAGSEGGETACWAHLTCWECGAMISEGHRPGCGSAPAAARGQP